MSDSLELKQQLQESMKAAMRGRQKDRLGLIRLVIAAVKQREIDERTSLNDEQVLAVMHKMIKQRRESISQYQAANRDELAEKEAQEITIIEEFLPIALPEQEVDQLIAETISALNASSMKDMGKVMNQLQIKLQGRTDIAQVSKKVKAKLS